MPYLRAKVTEHRSFLLVATLLTLLLTFPTILYVFRTDVFWLPTGTSHDVYIKLWDVWYGGRFLTGRADRFFTDFMFYPEGVSLTYHPFFIPHMIAANVIGLVLPLSNAYSLAYMLFTWAGAASGYVYLNWLFKDKWVAIFGAVVFGFSPHVLVHANHPGVAAAIAPIPLALYFFQRGVSSGRGAFVVVSGLITGLATVINMYGYVCLLITLGIATIALARSRWRERGFWFLVAALLLAIGLSSAWRILALVSDSGALESAIAWYGADEQYMDLVSFILHELHPVLGPFVRSALGIPAEARICVSSFLGFLPLALLAYGLYRRTTRGAALAWSAFASLFLLLELGAVLSVNGTVFEEIRLPKAYLDDLLPAVFRMFKEVSILHIGLLLPFAVAASYGLVALRGRFAAARSARFTLLLIALVAAEYYVPVREFWLTSESVQFMDWLASEETKGEVRLINLPMGRKNSKRYMLYQALSGYPHAEGAISRTPDSAFDYIRANAILNAWHSASPIACDRYNIDLYLSALAQLEDDGFSHVVFHRNVGNSRKVVDSFRQAARSYEDDFVWIYRLGDLRESCPD